MNSQKINIHKEIDNSEILKPSIARQRVRQYRGAAFSSFESEVEELIEAVERREVNQEETRQTFYALKAEFRNYKLLQNLYLTLPVLHRNRDRAGLPPMYEAEAREPEFDRQVQNQLELSQELIADYLKRLRPSRNRVIRSGGLKPQIQ